jgi:hypothetical protein
MAAVDPQLTTPLVQDLMAIVVAGSGFRDASKLKETALKLEEIAQTLLFVQVAQWPLETWRAHLPKFRNWHNHNENAITHSNKRKATTW